ncbi:MAG: LPXTG cell wall anchor domain-containing protein [Thermoleophilia bacterium]|nr:LPXTG cell wall anchor domain-containing protein [Thermoleophilia bacterium]
MKFRSVCVLALSVIIAAGMPALASGAPAGSAALSVYDNSSELENSANEQYGSEAPSNGQPPAPNPAGPDTDFAPAAVVSQYAGTGSSAAGSQYMGSSGMPNTGIAAIALPAAGLMTAGLGAWLLRKNRIQA